MNSKRVESFRDLYGITEQDARKIENTLKNLPPKYSRPIANQIGCSIQVVRNVRLGITANADILHLLLEQVRENKEKIKKLTK